MFQSYGIYYSLVKGLVEMVTKRRSKEGKKKGNKSGAFGKITTTRSDEINGSHRTVIWDQRKLLIPSGMTIHQ